ncbi:MAG: class I SAM-dependent methyltransferase [Gammaproteobacteria bacterium]
MSRKSLNLNDAVYDYMLSVSLDEPDILRRCREQTASHPMARMQIAPEQGQFFRFLVKSLGVRNAREIGVFTGYSSLAIALSLPDDGKLLACDNDPEVTNIAKDYWVEAGVEHKIDLRLAPALQTLDELLTSADQYRFDFAFIDAHKPEYIDYYEKLLPLMRSGGVLAIDNVLWNGNPADPDCTDEDTDGIRRFNEHVRQDTRVQQCLLPIADGITLAYKY